MGFVSNSRNKHAGEIYVNKIDRTILHILHDGIPIIKEPFAEIEKKVGISKDEIIKRLKRLIDDGVIRRFGISVNQRKVGIIANAVVAWKVPQNRVEEIGKAMSSYREITHCYERKVIPGRWEHNLFTVIHDYDRESVKRFVKKLSISIGLKEYLVLFSVKQFKRTSVPQFNQNHLE